VSTPKHFGTYAASKHVFVHRGMKTPVLNAGGYGVVQTEKEFDDLLDAVEAEWEQTPDAYMEFFVFTARKPGEPEERSV
jgi:hypothetical protein